MGALPDSSPVAAPARSSVPAWVRAIRPHQWAKNALLSVPAISGHRILSMEVLEPLGIAFIAYSLAASGVYVVNDLRDARADRAHPTKATRPIAAGQLSSGVALAIAGSCFALAFGIAWTLPKAFSICLAVYVALSTLYTFVLKRLLLIDVVTLSLLFTLRVIAGGFATAVEPSSWLLVFAVFFSTGLAFAKRYAELGGSTLDPHDTLDGRAYRPNDLDMVRTVGVSAGMLAVLVFALYAQSTSTRDLYSNPELLVVICPVLLYWFGRLWFLAGRAELDEDPVVFALKDPVSWICGFVTLGLVLVAR